MGGNCVCALVIIFVCDVLASQTDYPPSLSAADRDLFALASRAVMAHGRHTCSSLRCHVDPLVIRPSARLPKVFWPHKTHLRLVLSNIFPAALLDSELFGAVVDNGQRKRRRER